MAKITRKNQKIFGETAGVDEIAQIGSLFAGTPTFSTDPDVIQALVEYSNGWFNVAIGDNSPAEEDMNAFCYLVTRQLAYLFQSGTAEWNDTTTYYIGSQAQDGLGNIYISLTDNNTNNALTDAANWKPLGVSPNIKAVVFGDSPVTLVSGDSEKTLFVTTAGGAITINLPAPALNFRITFVDVGFVMGTNNLTISRNGGTYKIGNVASDFIAAANGGTWVLASNGTDYFFID